MSRPMSAFGPEADSCAASLVNQLVGAFEHCRRDSQTELFGGVLSENSIWRVDSHYRAESLHR